MTKNKMTIPSHLFPEETLVVRDYDGKSAAPLIVLEIRSLTNQVVLTVGKAKDLRSALEDFIEVFDYD